MANRKLILKVTTRQGERFTGSLGGGGLDERKGDEGAVAATGVGIGGVDLRPVGPRLGATRRSRREPKNQGEKDPRTHGWLSVLRSCLREGKGSELSELWKL